MFVHAGLIERWAIYTKMADALESPNPRLKFYKTQDPSSEV